MAGDIEKTEAGGFEDELLKIIDETEESKEAELAKTFGRAARAKIMATIKKQALARFGKLHPDVKVKFLNGPYRDSKEGIGPARRIR